MIFFIHFYHLIKLLYKEYLIINLYEVQSIHLVIYHYLLMYRIILLHIILLFLIIIVSDSIMKRIFGFLMVNFFLEVFYSC